MRAIETMNETIFLKLGGSLITEKTGVEEVRNEVLWRLAEELKQTREAKPDLRLVLGHGSGSFGHVAGAKYGTRHGVKTKTEWKGFTEVSAAASRLNEYVIAALQAVGLPAISLRPSASAICQDGRISDMAIRPLELALNAGLLPVVFGDVAFDLQRGGTIISTEEVMMVIADSLRPSWFLLAGETAGVLNFEGDVVPLITEGNLSGLLPALGGSRGTDVTGGMAAKVQSMLDLVAAQREMQILIFSGLVAGNLQKAILQPLDVHGSVLRQEKIVP